MIDAPHIVNTSAIPTAIIPLTIPRAEMANVMGPAIAELMAAVAAQGKGPAGPVYAHHFRMNPATFDFEVGVPVTAPIAESGRVKPGRWPAITVARTIYHGPYEGLSAAWRELAAWIETEGHMPAPDLWESYLAGPESSPDPANWRTELSRPLKGRPV